jgi:DNA-directed RNA polymerase specialized sigma24 family protein
MPSDSPSLEDNFLPAEPTHAQGAEFFAQVTDLLDGKPGDAAVVEAALSGWDGLLETIAADLYRVGSMLLGEGEQTIALIERAIANVDIQACRDHVEARHKARLTLAALAVPVLQQRNPGLLDAPAGEDGPAGCIEDDDLDAAGVSSAELEQMLTDPDNRRLRDWLEGLSVSLRVIFVLRAVGGFSSAEVAGLLDWPPDAVRSIFRQALCSLASQLLQATAAK